MILTSCNLLVQTNKIHFTLSVYVGHIVQFNVLFQLICTNFLILTVQTLRIFTVKFPLFPILFYFASEYSSLKNLFYLFYFPSQRKPNLPPFPILINFASEYSTFKKLVVKCNYRISISNQAPSSSILNSHPFCL